MEWLARLRKRSIKKALLPCILFLAIAIGIIAFSGAWRVVGMIFPRSLADLTPETAEGAYVSDDLYMLYGEFIEVERYRDNRPTGVITARYYVTDFDDIYYIGLKVHSGSLKKSEAMLDDCDAFWDALYDCNDFWEGRMSYDEFCQEHPLPVMHVSGTIKAMDNEELRYYKRFANNDADTIAIMLPYYIDMGQVGDLNYGTLALVWVLAIACVVIGLFPMIKACTGKSQKQVRATLAASGSLEMEAEKAATFYDSTEPVSGIRMGREFVYFELGPDSVLLRPWDVAWAYQSTTQHRTNGIPTGKTYAIVLRTMDGKSYNISMSKKQVETLLEAMTTAMPGTVLGYSKEIESLYLQNRAVFTQRWEEKVPGCTARANQQDQLQ